MKPLMDRWKNSDGCAIFTPDEKKILRDGGNQEIVEESELREAFIKKLLTKKKIK